VISPESKNLSPADKTADLGRPRPTKIWLIIVAVLVAIALGFWITLTPPGFWAKIRMIGYAVCHQIPSHSFFDAEHQFPLCARCTGMYLGCLIGLGFTWLQGKRQGFPPLWVWGVFGFFFLAFAFDGINSALGLIPGMKQVYLSQNWLRLATGFGTGLAMGSLLAVAFNQTIWEGSSDEKTFAQGRYFLMMVLATLVVAGLVLFGPSLVKQILMLLSTAGVVVMLTLIYSIPASMLVFGQAKVKNIASLWLPLLIGFLFMTLQLGGLAYLRFLITGTLLPINL
jgi:uncharacterized membrane protein